MREIEIVKYETIDGEIFDDEEEAITHEQNVCKLKCYDENGTRIPIESIESAIYLNIPDDDALEQFRVISEAYDCSIEGVLSPGKYMWKDDKYYMLDCLIEDYKNEIRRLTKLKEEL